MSLNSVMIGTNIKNMFHSDVINLDKCMKIARRNDIEKNNNEIKKRNRLPQKSTIHLYH